MTEFDLVVVGSGPGGYVAAIRAAQLHLKTAIVERAALGGICLNWGCIPSKSLLRNAELLELFQRAGDFGFTLKVERADLADAVARSRVTVHRMVEGIRYLLRKHEVDVIEGQGTLLSDREIAVEPNGMRLRASNIVLATGARARELPGLRVDGERVITSREALAFGRNPRSIVIVGGGAVGCEFAYLFRTYGAEVTVVEQLPHLLPMEDEEISIQLERAFNKRGITVLSKSRVAELTPGEGGVNAVIDRDGERESRQAEHVLVGIGVRGNSDGLGLENAGVRVERDWVPVDGRMRTNVSGIYAIGDLTGPPLLAHVASAQGVVAAECIAGLEPEPLDYEQAPRATYCQPEVGAIGLTEAQARERFARVDIGRFPFRANGRAVAMGEPEGLVKVVVNHDSGEFAGIHMVGAGATELLGEASLALRVGATSAQVATTIHAHPTLSEAVKEAALAASGEAIHVWQDSRTTQR
jgi:dihydrolipoamide dehydrogenase